MNYQLHIYVTGGHASLTLDLAEAHLYSWCLSAVQSIISQFTVMGYEIGARLTYLGHGFTFPS